MIVFVFGSNLAGRHGKGAALEAAQKYGAQYGVGWGRTGRAYAIPTKDGRLRPLPLDRIEVFIGEFIEYACDHPDITFLVTKVGCGLAGYSEQQIKPFFAKAPSNCSLPLGWREA